jgi:isopentenyldiphosphate isomerase
MTKVVVVDEQDTPVGHKSYDELKYQDIYRVSALWLTDNQTGDILITQRKWTKHNDPGKWMAAVSGTIEEGENYDENIVHEIEEEIGLKNLLLEKGPKEFTDDGQHRYFVQWYFSTINKDTVEIQIQEEEVEAYTWLPKQELLRELKEKPDKFVSSFEKDLKALKII